MITSRARLAVAPVAGRSRATRLVAGAPQRWTLMRTASRDDVEVVHQLLGDGLFAGEVHRTAIEVNAGASATVRGLTAVPLRDGRPSAQVVRIRLHAGATAFYLPGALIPQAGSSHTSALRIEMAAGARLLAASVVVPGRSGMQERGRFSRLELRTVARVGGGVALAEHARLEGGPHIDTPAIFGGAGASLTVLALGDWAPATIAWWQCVPGREGSVGGVTSLRYGGVSFRALCASLGEASALLRSIEDLARH